MGESGPRRADLTTSAEAAWTRLHHGLDPARVPMLQPWLRVVWSVARPLRAVPPSAVTVVGALLAIDALLLAADQPWVALVLVLVATWCDALDGAIAILAHRASAAGAMADKIADRIADSAFALTIWRCGAPLWLAVVAGASSLVLEAVRELLGGARRTRITVAERPTRVICTVLACGAAGVSSAIWPPTVCAAVWACLGVIGIAQVVPA
jgi:CDP-diacylglycerol--glycerol-3-phosphate 3-phosphatidyltransferase